MAVSPRYIPGNYEARPCSIGTGWRIITSDSWHVADVGALLPNRISTGIGPTALLMAAGANTLKAAAQSVGADPLAMATAFGPDAIGIILEGARMALSRLDFMHFMKLPMTEADEKLRERLAAALGRLNETAHCLSE